MSNVIELASRRPARCRVCEDNPDIKGICPEHRQWMDDHPPDTIVYVRVGPGTEGSALGHAWRRFRRSRLRLAGGAA